ncbi:glycoside hydrolase family protein [Rhizobium sp. BK008]|uniref:glycoside hydrolase family protein n=1 Tax=Rhizobium sp. BK008 TaxID=2587094 RepID=UPI0028AC78DE|nr:hypothetical protein [Rhizobium sp. BK008]
MSSATLTQTLNAGDPEGATGEFERWNKRRGACLTGLSRDPSARRRCFAMLTTATTSSGFSKARMGARSISPVRRSSRYSVVVRQKDLQWRALREPLLEI